MARTLGDIKTPQVNLMTLKRVMSSVVKENIFQGIVFRPEEAVTEKYSTDVNAAQIQIIRVKPHDIAARELGADVNGGWFNSDDAAVATTEAYGIDILKSVDRNIDIPTVAQDMVNTDVAAAELENLAGLVNREINGATLAAQLATNFNAEYENTVDNWCTITAGAEDYKTALLTAGTHLDSGNEAQGIDFYPIEKRAIILRPQACADLLAKGILTIGGANKGYDILEKGTVSADATRNDAIGYRGEFSGMPVYVASPSIWSKAEKYLGLNAGALAKVYGLVVSSVGTGRALAFAESIKTIDSPSGQGIRLQPKYRFGVECWDAKSVVPIVASDFANPVVSNETKLSVVAPESRG